MYQVRFMSTGGKFQVLKTEEFASMKAAETAVSEHYTKEGFSNFKTLEEDDPCTWRITARTPGGRNGRNVAYVDFLPNDEEW